MSDILNTLCRWHCTFNTWKWPADFPIPKPDGFDDLPERDLAAMIDKFRVIEPYIAALGTITPHKEQLRYWNTRHCKPGMTESEFAEWWKRCYETTQDDPDADTPLAALAAAGGTGG